MRSIACVAGIVAVSATYRTYIYVDEYSNQPESALIPYYENLINAGATDIMNAFMVPNCPCPAPDLADSVGDWVRMSPGARQRILDLIHSKNGLFHLVTGGGTYNQQYLSFTPKAFTDLVCGHARDYGYDGVDFDLEHLPAGFGPSHITITWAIEATKLCRNFVGHITHAPQSPYFGTWGNFGYEALLPYVDKMLIQYYNQGASANHHLWQNIFISDIHQASIYEIEQRNPEYADKLVVGKYMYPNHGGSGMMTADAIADMLHRSIRTFGYTGGIMLWKYPDAWDTVNLNNFLKKDLPLIVEQNVSWMTTSSTAAAVTSSTTAAVTSSTTTRPENPVLPTIAPSSTTPQTTSTTTTTRAAVGGGSPVEVCRTIIGHPSNSVWHDDCHNLCEVYATLLFGHCPQGVSTGTDLALCVMRQHPHQCFAI